MDGHNRKITHQTKNQESHKLNDKSQSTDPNPEINEPLEAPNKDLKHKSHKSASRIYYNFCYNKFNNRNSWQRNRR